MPFAVLLAVLLPALLPALLPVPVPVPFTATVGRPLLNGLPNPDEVVPSVDVGAVVFEFAAPTAPAGAVVVVGASPVPVGVPGTTGLVEPVGFAPLFGFNPDG